MSELWTAADIAKATGGKASADWSVSGVSIDSRSLEEGDLFVPLKDCLLYTSPSPRDKRQSRMPSSA